MPSQHRKRNIMLEASSAGWRREETEVPIGEGLIRNQQAETVNRMGSTGRKLGRGF